MAKRVRTELVDDVDGSEADETITFAIEGTAYTIDLSKKNASKLRSAFIPWVESAQKVGRAATAAGGGWRPTNAQRTGLNRDENRAIRDWLSFAGFEIPNRGRIRGELVDAYRNRTSMTQTELHALLLVHGTEEMKASLKQPAPAVPAQKKPTASAAAPTNGAVNGAAVNGAAATAVKAAKPPQKKVTAAAAK